MIEAGKRALARAEGSGALAPEGSSAQKRLGEEGAPFPQAPLGARFPQRDSASHSVRKRALPCHEYSTLGSAAAYARSARMFTSTNTTLRNRMLPWMAGRSRLLMAFTT